MQTDLLVGQRQRRPQLVPKLPEVAPEPLSQAPQDQHAQRPRHDAQDAPENCAQELCHHMLPGPDGEGVHEIALVGQKVFIKAVDDPQGGDDHRGHGHQRQQQGEHRREDPQQAAVGSVELQAPENPAQDTHAQDPGKAGQEEAACGPNFIAQQFP